MHIHTHTHTQARALVLRPDHAFFGRAPWNIIASSLPPLVACPLPARSQICAPSIVFNDGKMTSVETSPSPSLIQRVVLGEENRLNRNLTSTSMGHKWQHSSAEGRPVMAIMFPEGHSTIWGDTWPAFQFQSCQGLGWWATSNTSNVPEMLSLLSLSCDDPLRDFLDFSPEGESMSGTLNPLHTWNQI